MAVNENFEVVSNRYVLKDGKYIKTSASTNEEVILYKYQKDLKCLMCGHKLKLTKAHCWKNKVQFYCPECDRIYTSRNFSDYPRLYSKDIPVAHLLLRTSEKKDNGDE